MLELAEQSEMAERPTLLDSTKDGDTTATKEAVNFLFKQIMSCISDMASQIPTLHEHTEAAIDNDATDKDVIIAQHKTIIKQLQETNREIINKQTIQMHVLKDHFDNLRACVDLREISRQKLEFSTLKLKSEIAKIKQQVSEYEQKTEIKALNHSEDVHALQQLVQRLVSGESRDANVLSMSQGGSLFQNPNAPSLNLRDSAPFVTRDHLRDNSGIPANLHTLFDSKLRTSSSTKHSSATRGRGLDMMDTDVLVSGEHDVKAVSGSLRDLHEITRIHAGAHELDKDVIVVDKSTQREVYELPRDIREKRDTRGSHEVPRRNEGIRNGSFPNYGTESLHIEDEGEEGDRKRLKTDADRHRLQVPKQTPLRSTHPRSPHVSPLLQGPRVQSPLLPNYHQFQPQQRTANNSIKKLSSSSGSPPPPQAIKGDKESTQAPANGQKKEPSEIWASEVLLAFSQGTDSPTDTTPALAVSGDLKRRLSSDDVPPPPNNNSLVVSGGVTNSTDSAEDPHAALRRISDELTMRRSSGGFDEYSFSRSSGGISMGPLGASGHKKRRGKLPETATSLLKRWLLEHQQHPYPTEEEKAGLATTTSLTLNQINNWFTNARRRILPKQKHPGSPPSSPPSSTQAMHHHNGPHHDDHEHYDNNSPSSSTTNNNNSNTNNTNTHHLDTSRPVNSNPTSPTFSNHTNYSSSNNTNHTPLHNSTGTPNTHNFNTITLQNPSALLSQLAHTSALSTPLMAQLTAQLAQRLSANPTPRTAPSPSSTTILSLSKRSTELEPTPMDIKSSNEMEDTPSTAPHTISLATQKTDHTQHRDSPITISSEQKQTQFQSKLTSPLRISSPTPPLIKEPPSSSPTPTTATLTPAATLTTSPSPSSTTPATHHTTYVSPSISSVPNTQTTLHPLPTHAPISRPPIFPTHPLFAQPTASALSTLAHLGVSVIPAQAPDPTPQPM